MKGFKGFDKNLKCRGMQFEVGNEYKIENNGIPIALFSGTCIHFCKTIQGVNDYYDCCDSDNRYCEVEAIGEIVETNDICGTDHIRIVKEIVGEELDILLGRIKGNTGLWNSGNRNSGDWNSGDGNSGNCNSGDWNSGNRNSGDGNMGHRNSGYRNSGDCNSGNCNSGDWNSGDQNSGDCNSGNRNSGDFNSGNCNSGDWNSGDWNSTNHESGVFNTKEPCIRMFNKDTNIKYGDWEISRAYQVMKTIQVDAQKWWDELSADDKQSVLDMPNFDKDIFNKITGVDIKAGGKNDKEIL